MNDEHTIIIWWVTETATMKQQSDITCPIPYVGQTEHTTFIKARFFRAQSVSPALPTQANLRLLETRAAHNEDEGRNEEDGGADFVQFHCCCAKAIAAIDHPNGVSSWSWLESTFRRSQMLNVRRAPPHDKTGRVPRDHWPHSPRMAREAVSIGLSSQC